MSTLGQVFAFLTDNIDKFSVIVTDADGVRIDASICYVEASIDKEEEADIEQLHIAIKLPNVFDYMKSIGAYGSTTVLLNVKILLNQQLVWEDKGPTEQILPLRRDYIRYLDYFLEVSEITIIPAFIPEIKDSRIITL